MTGSLRPSAWEGICLLTELIKSHHGRSHLDCPQLPVKILIDDVERAVIKVVEPGFNLGDIYVSTQYLYTLEFYGDEEWAREIRG